MENSSFSERNRVYSSVHTNHSFNQTAFIMDYTDLTDSAFRAKALIEFASLAKASKL